jgi:hypothetical protein
MPTEYPWYESVEGSDLAQGDLLVRCPVLIPAPTLDFPLPEDDIPADIVELDVIVMTQACDLAQQKLKDVVLCPHWNTEDAIRHDPKLGKVVLSRRLLSVDDHAITS